MTTITITRAGPLATLQDQGRYGVLAHGISASGPTVNSAFHEAGGLLETPGTTGIEFTSAGLAFTVDGPLRAAAAGGDFSLSVNGDRREWPATLALAAGDGVDVAPGSAGNYGYLRFERELDVPALLGSRSTNLAVGLGGYRGRALKAGDQIAFGALGTIGKAELAAPSQPGPIRFTWGVHADQIPRDVRERFTQAGFLVSTRLDRMGVRLEDPEGVFTSLRQLSLVSEAIVVGDIQILGDGTPVVLMRDHQPTGGYPRIATIVSVDFDRFAQMRPGSTVHFQSVVPGHRR
ncbi:MAG: biotin-dependent carboxyltransferase family protein [Devosia sp.]